MGLLREDRPTTSEAIVRVGQISPIDLPVVRRSRGMAFHYVSRAVDLGMKGEFR